MHTHTHIHTHIHTHTHTTHTHTHKHTHTHTHIHTHTLPGAVDWQMQCDIGAINKIEIHSKRTVKVVI